MEQPVELNPQPDFSSITDPYLKMSKRSHVNVHEHIKRGNPREEIEKMSGEYDLIIMGTSGRNPIVSVILGSVAEHVARHALCPVMLVRKKT
jgi:nucleotide-binding universal stress UspA family protein